MDAVALITALAAAISAIGNIYSTRVGNEENARAVDAVNQATKSFQQASTRYRPGLVKPRRTLGS
jgi:hypothetical protein